MPPEGDLAQSLEGVGSEVTLRVVPFGPSIMSRPPPWPTVIRVRRRYESSQFSQGAVIAWPGWIGSPGVGRVAMRG